MKGLGGGVTARMRVKCSEVGDGASGRLSAFSRHFAANPTDALHLGES